MSAQVASYQIRARVRAFGAFGFGVAYIVGARLPAFVVLVTPWRSWTLQRWW